MFRGKANAAHGVRKPDANRAICRNSRSCTREIVIGQKSLKSAAALKGCPTCPGRQPWSCTGVRSVHYRTRRIRGGEHARDQGVQPGLRTVEWARDSGSGGNLERNDDAALGRLDDPAESAKH